MVLSAESIHHIQAVMSSLHVPVLPASLHQSALHYNHDIATAGHQGFDKPLQHLTAGSILGQHGQGSRSMLPAMHHMSASKATLTNQSTTYQHTHWLALGDDRSRHT